MARTIEGRAAIEVDVNDRGRVVIRQDGATGTQSGVELTHHDVPQVIQMLRDAAKEAKNFKP